MAIPGPLDAIATITMTLYGNGEMAISGNIDDIRLATQLFDHAKEAVVNQWNQRHANKLVIPNRDVDISPVLPLQQYGDVPQDLRPVQAGGQGGHH